MFLGFWSVTRSFCLTALLLCPTAANESDGSPHDNLWETRL